MTDELVVNRFLQQLLEDRLSGDVRSLEAYQALFPEDAELVAEQYREAVDGGGALPGDADSSGLGPYRIDRLLGRGGQATVYLAEDTRLHRRVALKVLSSGPHSGEALLRFRREAEVASQLDHPGICTVFEAGIEKGSPYIAMQYLEGDTLAQKIARSSGGQTSGTVATISLDSPAPDAATAHETPSQATTHVERGEILRVVELVEQAARALHVAHEAGVLHRDIKPANIMVEPDGRPVIADFGLARQEDSDLPTLTRTGELFGTPAYMSPEQLTRQAIQLDRRSDVWSLGATLYECLTMHRPFEGPTREALYQAILTREPPDPHRLNPAVSQDLKIVLETALQKDRDRRYQTALDFAEDLRRVRKSEPILARPISIFGRTWRWAKRRPARATLAAVLLVGIPLLAGLGGFILANLDDIQEREAQKRREQVERLLEDAYLAFDDASLPLFERALELDPDDVEALAGVALIHLEEHRQGEALAVLDRRPELVAASHGLTRVRITALKYLGNRPEELMALEEALPPRELASDFFLAGHEQARLALFRGAKDWEAAKKLFLQAVLLTKGNPRPLYHFNLAKAAAFAGDAKLAGKLADSMIEIWPDSALVWHGRGLALRKGTKDLEGAVAAYQKALQIRPELYRIWFSLGCALREAKRLDESIDALKQCVAQRADFYWAWTELGNSLRLRKGPGDLDEALRCCERAVEIAPRHAPAQNYLGLVHSRRGRADLALEAHRRAAKIRPDYRVYRSNVVGALRQLARWSEAADAQQEVIALEPRVASHHHRRADLLRDAWRLEEAFEVYEELIAKAPPAPANHACMGRAHAKSGDDERAVAGYRDALEIDAEFSSAWAGLGHALRRLARYGEAVKAFERYLEVRRTRGADIANAERYLRDCQRMLELQDHLEAAVEGRALPDEVHDLICLARMCRYAGYHAVAAGIWEKVFARSDEPEAGTPHRRWAAVAAALAGAGASRDQVSDAERARCRARSVRWLGEELDACRERLRGDGSARADVAGILHEWRHQPEYAALREAERLAALDEHERAAWSCFWREVEEVLDQIRNPVGARGAG